MDIAGTSRRRRVRLTVAVLIVAVAGHAGWGTRAMSPPPDCAETVNFAALSRARSPNSWLVAPPGLTPEPPDEAAPTFAMRPDDLARAWIAVVSAAPRTRIVCVSADGLGIEAEQASAIFGFIDRISARVLPLDGDASTLAVYSRSQRGYWDLGVNRTRVRDWIAALKTRAATAG